MLQEPRLPTPEPLPLYSIERGSSCLDDVLLTAAQSSTHLVLNTGGWWGGGRGKFLEISLEIVFEALLSLGHADKRIIFHHSGLSAENKDGSCGPTIEAVNSSDLLSNATRSALEIHAGLLSRLKSRHPSIRFLDTYELSSLRVDNHPGSPRDCQHWRLPGVPDTWNLLMLNTLWS